MPTWTVWGGNTVHQPTWAIHFSADTPADVLKDLAFELANGVVHKPAPPELRQTRLATRTQAHTSPAPLPTSAPGRSR
ncbi:DUF317 domain-containing protein [Streptomyces lutosisoli]|uniref:DUF317 domain-containing protein n=1 Tax=Streptomyces lutosisoli TaxID=2665721 RepID=A0ABW2W0F9_9ACTN